MPVEYSIVYCFLKPLNKNQFEDSYSKLVSLLGLFQVEFQDIRGKPLRILSHNNVVAAGKKPHVYFSIVPVTSIPKAT